MCPSSNVKHQVTGSGQGEAFEDDPLLPVLGWTQQSIQAGQGCGEGSQVPPEGPGDHADLIWAKRTMESAGGSASVLPGCISVQTARIHWLHPNRQKNTDNSLVAQQAQQAQSSYENFRMNLPCAVQSVQTPNKCCERAYK